MSIYIFFLGNLTFQSTLPVRGATSSSFQEHFSLYFQSTLPVRGATFLPSKGVFPQLFSIHAPREGSDKRLLL